MIKRYGAAQLYDDHGSPMMEEYSDGEWVRWEDLKPRLLALLDLVDYEEGSHVDKADLDEAWLIIDGILYFADRSKSFGSLHEDD